MCSSISFSIYQVKNTLSILVAVGKGEQVTGGLVFCSEANLHSTCVLNGYK